MGNASSDSPPSFNHLERSYNSFICNSLVSAKLPPFPSKSKPSLHTELTEILDKIVKELINEMKGVKEDMHMIMEEEAMYEESVIGSPVLSDMEEDPEFGEPQSNGDSLTADRSYRKSSNNSEKPFSFEDFKEKDLKDGRILFNIFRGEVANNMPLKSASGNPERPDLYLDRVTFIGRKMVSIWFGKSITVEHFNMVIDLLKDRNFLFSFPLMLESFRKLNYFEIDEKGYQTFCELILCCLSEVASFDLVPANQERGNPPDSAQYGVYVLHEEWGREDHIPDGRSQETLDIQR